jgi:hypothetical protein
VQCITEILRKIISLLKQNVSDEKKDTVINAVSCTKIIADLAGKETRL